MAEKKQAASTAKYIPKTNRLGALNRAMNQCRGCELYKQATQAVPGRGNQKASIVMIGEKPGDTEDKAGEAFIGPAGRMLSRALEDAGIPAEEIYITNAVKHFKWKSSEFSKKRLHQKPSSREISACKPWLEEEIRIIGPEALICLGATAAASVFGKATPIGKNRGRWLESPFSLPALITAHPSAILREIDRSAKEKAYQQLVADLSIATEILSKREAA